MEANDLQDSHIGKDAVYLFPLKFCGHRWLENSKAIIRINKISKHMVGYMDYIIEKKRMPSKDERFTYFGELVFERSDWCRNIGIQLVYHEGN